MEEFADRHDEDNMDISQLPTHDNSEGDQAPHSRNAESATSDQALQQPQKLRGPGSVALRAGLPSAYLPLVDGLEEDELLEPDWSLPGSVLSQSRKKKGKKKKSTPQVQDQLKTAPLPRAWHSFTAGHMVFDGNDDGDVRIQDAQFQFPFSAEVCHFILAPICCLS